MSAASVPLNKDDTVSRSIISPKDYTSGGILDLTKSFEFPSNDGSCESVNCHRLVNDNIDILHSLGIQKQEAAKARGKDSAYKGYIAAVVEKITSLKKEDYHFSVYTFEDKENPAHCHLQLHYEQKQKSKRNALLSDLFECFNGIIPVPPNFKPIHIIIEP